MTDLVDWDLAVATGVRATPSGPRVTPEQAHEVVTGLRHAALAAVEPVRAVSGLVAERDVPVLVVDRRNWMRANVATMREVMGPVAAAAPAGAPLVRAVGSRLTAVEVGAVLGWLSGKVLGQYDLIGPESGAGVGVGRLLLVAPNIVAAERTLGVPSDDFRLWVCLHEETHRVQFGAAPWLRAHLLDGIADLVAGLAADPGEALTRLRSGLGAIARGLMPGGDGDGMDLLSATLPDRMRPVAERLVAVMSLLEGHADVVMDEVGPQVVASVDLLRERMEIRRDAPGAFDGVIRRLLGMDAKLRQYRDGARFVRAVIERVGMDGFNAVWESPDRLPSAAEIADPSLWVSRVHA